MTKALNDKHYVELSKSCRRALYSVNRSDRIGQLILLYCDWGDKLEAGTIDVSTHQRGLTLLQTTVVLSEADLVG